MEWEIFLNQAKSEIRTSERIELTYNRILLIKDGRLILYEKYGNKLRRRVDGTGHEILLFNIQSFDYKKIEKGITITINHQNGQTYSTEIYIPNGIPIDERQ